jgi:hypothetical protein
MKLGTSLATWGWQLGLAALLAQATPAFATILVTTDQGEVDAFAAGADVEEFEGINATAFGSYDPGQLIASDSRFSSRDPGRTPTFHSGGASPGDPVGNPGTPIGIIDPSAGIGADVKSGIAVGAPLVINTDEAWNGAFMEVIFPEPVERVGFWITHGGTVNLDLRDVNGSTLPTGDVSASGTKGQFVGILRPEPDIKVAALFLSAGDAFTIDDFVSTAAPVPEPAAALLLAAGGVTLAALRRRRA